ncbi:MAG: tyrosine recombinase XerC [Clostridia bacterium]|nr:tyrosine recombinase XerC [Clostridia bacterium]
MADKLQQYDDIPPYARRFLIYMTTILGKSEKTVHEYYYDLRTFFRFMKCYFHQARFEDFETIDTSDFSLDDFKNLTTDDLYEYLMYVRNSRDNSPNALARKISALKSFYNYLTVKAHIIENNIAKDLESPKLPKKLPRYLTLEESKRLLEAVDGEFATRDYAIITLFLNCGMRLSELVGINIRDIQENSIFIRGKGNKERKVYLNDACVSALNDYLAVRPHDAVSDRDALFLSKRKTRISNNMVYRMVKKNMERAGLDPDKYSPHKLRHTAATLMYVHGDVDVRALQEILGHEQLSTTQIYTHVDEKQLRDAVSRNPLAEVKREEKDENKKD